MNKRMALEGIENLIQEGNNVLATKRNSDLGGKYYVEKTKTECGCRFIPMTEEVYHSLKNILANRPKLKTEKLRLINVTVTTLFARKFA